MSIGGKRVFARLAVKELGAGRSVPTGLERITELHRKRIEVIVWQVRNLR